MKKRISLMKLFVIMLVTILTLTLSASAEDNSAIKASFSEFVEADHIIRWDFDINGLRTADGSAYNDAKVSIEIDKTLLQFPEDLQDGTGDLQAERQYSGNKISIYIPSKYNKISGKPYYDVSSSGDVIIIYLNDLAEDEAYLVYLDTEIVSDVYFNTYDQVKFSADTLFEGMQSGIPCSASSKAEVELGRTPPSYTVTVTNDGYGSAGANPSSGAEGTLVTLSAVPSDGYEFDHWEVISGGVTVTDDQFSIGSLDVEIKACFREIVPEYTVTVTNDGHGSAGANPSSGAEGTLVTLSAVPSDGYEFDHWEVVSGGVTVTDDQFSIGSLDVEIKACFREIVPPTAVLTGISISKAPDKMIYNEGETFDRTGMVITATYSDGSSRTVTDYTLTPSGTLSVTDTSVEIRYTENGVTKTASLAIQVNPAKPVVYRIISGMNQTVLTDAEHIVFTSDADFSKFDHVEVDGATVAKKYYAAGSGSTVITFNREFIKKLSVGKHKLTIVSSDGSASTTFTVRNPLPITGDNTDYWLLMMLILASLGALVLITVKTRKRDIPR